MLGAPRPDRLLAAGWSSEVFEVDRPGQVLKMARSVVPGFDDDVSRQALARAWGRELAALDAVAGLDGVPALLDAGTTDGRPWMLLQRAPGDTLWNVRRRRQLSAEEIVCALEGLASCLTVLHGRGWLHLDLNPGNVMLAEDGTVTLLDFGAAQLAGRADPWDWPLGRHRYMAHEHIAGRRETPPYGRLSKASDVHQLACLTMYMVTAREPFRGCLPEEEYRDEYLEALSAWSSRPAPVRVRSVLAGDAALRQGAVRALARATETDPADRTGEPAQFVVQWRAALSDVPAGSAATTRRST